MSAGWSAVRFAATVVGIIVVGAAGPVFLGPAGYAGWAVLWVLAWLFGVIVLMTWGMER